MLNSHRRVQKSIINNITSEEYIEYYTKYTSNKCYTSILWTFIHLVVLPLLFFLKLDTLFFSFLLLESHYCKNIISLYSSIIHLYHIVQPSHNLFDDRDSISFYVLTISTNSYTSSTT